MTISIIVAILALGVPFVLRAAKGRKTLPKLDQLRPVDLRAFRNLMDPEEEAYLRHGLSPADFRRIQRERMRAAVEYIQCAASNAAILTQFAEAARHSPNPAIAKAAENLIHDAIQLRAYAFRAIPKLYVAILFPGRGISPARVAESYERMTRQVVLLGIKYPTGGISASL